jgi:hypothetical protein
MPIPAPVRPAVATKAAEAGDTPSALTFVVPMPPTLTNSAKGRSRHWRALERETTLYWSALDWAQRIGSIPAPPPAPWPKARIASVMVLGGAMDDDNAMARHKWLKDWLVTRGYLVSDRKTCLTWEGFPGQRVTRKERPSITITLTRVEAA